MYCPNCHKKIGENATICPFCDNDIKITKKERRMKNKKILICLLGVLLLFTAFLFFYIPQTPEYSMYEIVQSVKNSDYDSFEEYVNLDEIIDNLLAENIYSKSTNNDFFSFLAQSFAEYMKPTIKKNIQLNIENYIESDKKPYFAEMNNIALLYFLTFKSYNKMQLELTNHTNTLNTFYLYTGGNLESNLIFKLKKNKKTNKWKAVYFAVSPFTEWYIEANKQNTIIEKAQKSYSKNALFKKNSEKEILFYDVYKLAEESTEIINKKLWDSGKYIDDSYVQRNRIRFNNLGFDFVQREGQYYFEINYKFLIKTANIPKSWKNWLLFKEKYKYQWEEGGSTLTPEENRKVILELENMIKQNPDFVAKQDIKQELDMYILNYLTYFENYCTQFNIETNLLKDDYKLSYEKFLQENKQSDYYPIVKTYYEKLQKNGFKNSDSIHNWIRNKLN